MRNSDEPRLADLSCREYVEKLASKEPAPGGGSAAALVGALATALGSMVANFTVGREDFAKSEKEVQSHLERLEEIREELLELVNEDAVAYRRVAKAFKLPRNTAHQKQRRAERLEKALRGATAVPMAVAEHAREVLRIGGRLAHIGNPRLITDAAMAACLGEIALLCARLNVEINLVSIQDVDFVQAQRAQLRRLLRGAEAARRKVYDLALQKL